ncbi:STAS domain-containing protein [Amycolatopsis vancoresmycina]|uniref:Anti-anti-sigma factor n=1 Tax=Amycolatopsis vancoresmycina DSM 44592 TaxID=1292037 RepID=R1IJF9_9PSEU|nr:STAS domain-containing protein [Amycolatopsis vancoresmycina]EOD70494.1 anti-anti-sigma factor [Amycolatopsis vancoresmycina DSM 44592]
MGVSFEPERLEIVRLETSSGIVALALTGELDAGTTPKLASALVRALDEVPEVLVLDLSRLSFISVAGARSIRLTHDAAGATRLRIVTGGSRAADVLLHRTGFAAVLDCYPTRAAALSAGSRTSFLSQAKANWNN